MKSFSIILGLLIILVWIGSISENLSVKKGNNGTIGLLLGVFLGPVGLGIVYLIPKKTDFEFKKSLPIRIGFGIIRLVVVCFILFFLSMFDVVNGTRILQSLDGLIPLYLILIGGLWVVRGLGKYNTPN